MLERLFVREDGGFVNIKKEQGVGGYSIVDSTASLRGKPALQRRRSIAKRFNELSSVIDALDEPVSVKRTAKMLLKDFIEYEVNRVNRFFVLDREVLIRTLIYYARILNSLPAKRPPKMDKRVKRFVFSSGKYSGNLKRNIVNNRSVYVALMSGIDVISDQVGNDVYAIATTLDKYVRPNGKNSLKTIAGAVLYSIALESGWSKKDIAKFFTVVKVLKHNTTLFYKKNEEFVRRIVSQIPEEERNFIEEKMRAVVGKVFKSV